MVYPAHHETDRPQSPVACVQVEEIFHDGAEKSHSDEASHIESDDAADDRNGHARKYRNGAQYEKHGTISPSSVEAFPETLDVLMTDTDEFPEFSHDDILEFVAEDVKYP